MARDYTFDILDYKEPITKIYFVRHGQTKANRNGLIFGQWDLPLNQIGIKQAKKAASRLVSKGRFQTCHNNKINSIICSPLKRTCQTAKIIRSAFIRAGFKPAPTIIIDKNLIEKSEGIWQKHTYWDLKTFDPKNFKKWIKDPYRTRPPKGESVLDLLKRMKKFHNTVLKKYKGKNIIVVTHSGPIRAFILHILNANPNKFWYFKTETGAITEIRVSKKHAMVWKLNS